MNSDELNRRQMLAVTAVGSTQLCMSHQLFAADYLDVLSFIIVSDTHLGRKDNASAEQNWRNAIDEINQQPGEFVLHLGDVVDAAREAQYPIYVETRKLLKKPIHEIPGNHDPVDLFKKYVAKETDRSIDYGSVRFVLFNNAHPDAHNGFITGDQLEWLETQFAGAAKKDLRIVVCCHVPIHTNKHPDRGWYVKPADGQDTFYELQSRYADRILAIMHGHFHNGIRGWRDRGQMVETLCPSICYNQDRGLAERIAAGEATGFFVDELRPGYVLAELGKGKLTLRYKPLGADQRGVYTAAWS